NLLDIDDVGLHEGGYLFLATPEGAETLAEDHALQTGMGADIRHFDVAGLAAQFPYLSTDGLVGGCWGASGEGWFDGYRLMGALRAKARTLTTVTLLHAQVDAIETTGGRASGLLLSDGSRISAGHVAVTAGTSTPALLRPLGIDLPVVTRKRIVFSCACRSPLAGFPLHIDPSSDYARPGDDKVTCCASALADR